MFYCEVYALRVCIEMLFLSILELSCFAVLSSILIGRGLVLVDNFVCRGVDGFCICVKMDLEVN